MAKYSVLIYAAAQQDLFDIVQYLNTLSPDAAIGQYDRIVDHIVALQDMPERYPVCKDTQLQLKGYRMMVVDHYIVFYVVKEGTVQIRRILYGARKYDWLL